MKIISLCSLVKGIFKLFILASIILCFPIFAESVDIPSISPIINANPLDHWHLRNPTTLSRSLNGVAYGNGTFVAVGDEGTILTSPDGVAWTERTSGTSSDLQGVAYGNGIFVAVGSYETIINSPDGVSWTIGTNPFSGGADRYLYGVAYGNGTFVALGWTTVFAHGTIFFSSDGVSWGVTSLGDFCYLYGVAYGNGTFVAVGRYGIVLTSPEGVSWTQRTSGEPSSDLSGVAYGNGTFVAVGGTILTSHDGVSWIIRTLGDSRYLNGVAYGNGTFVALGSEGTILTSSDGITWTQRTSGTSRALSGIAYGNDTFVAVGSSGTILQSDPLTGTPKISINPVSLNFGDVNVGSTSNKRVTVKNDGNADLIIGTITSPSVPFNKIGDECAGQTFAPGASCTLTYQFSPTSAGSFSSNSNILSNDPDENPVTISLNGVGVAETVSIPNILTGPISGANDVLYSYTTGGSTSNLGHDVQYLIDWGGGTNSGWLPVGTTTASKSWSSAGTYSVKAQARCATDTSVVSLWSGSLSVNISLAPVPSTVATNPSGLQIIVDGSTYTAPHSFDWIPDSSHNLSVSSPQSGTPGTRYVYSSWSDGGAQSHTITAPSSSTTYTANFTTQYSLTTSVNPPEGGTASPSGTNWYDSGQVVSISVTVNPGYTFSGWSGDLSGTINPISITMNSNKNVTANFSVNAEWTVVNPPEVSSDWWLNAVYFTSQNEGWAVGEDLEGREQGHVKGVLLRYFNGSWGSIIPPYFSSYWWLQDVHFTSSNEGWAVGRDYEKKEGCLLHYRDRIWTPVPPPDVSSDWELYSVHFTSLDEGWAVGNDGARGVLLHYLNGSWTSVSPPSIHPPDVRSVWELNGIHFISSNEGWAVGRDWLIENQSLTRRSGVLFHYYDGLWTPVDLPLVSSDWQLFGIQFTSPNEGWAVGRDYLNETGVILHCYNGSWTMINPPYVSSHWGLENIHFISSIEGWAVGNDYENHRGCLLHYSNGSWKTINSPSVSFSVWLNDVYFSSSKDGWAVGNDTNNKRGALLRYSSVAETVSTPNTPNGLTNGAVGTSYTYSTEGASSNLGHSIQYLFDWGDQTTSGWLPVGITSASHSWGSSGTYPVKVQARCATDTSVVSLWSGSLSVNISLAPVPSTVATNPSGLQIIVDGSTYTAPHSFDWIPDSSHNLSVSSPQDGTTGTRYVYSSWSDGGAQTHTVTAPSSSTTYTANFTTQYTLTTFVNPPEGGTATPSGTNWYDSGQNVSVSATSNPGYAFSNWSGDLSGTATHRSIMMNGPKNVTANFTQNQYTLTVNIDPSGSGTVTKNPNNSTYVYGDQVTLTATPNAEYAFSNWTGDASGSSNPITFTINANKTITANFAPIPETISTPDTPNGPSIGVIGTSYSYSTGGAVSNLGHSLKYQYDWQGNGSDLSSWGSATQSKTWTTALTRNVRVRARCATHTSVVSAWSNYQIMNILGSYTITTNPSGLQITVDSTDYTSPKTFQWESKSEHTLGVAFPQSPVPGIRYVFAYWSDGGSQAHTITAPYTNASYTAHFTTQYSLTTSINPVGAGTVNPSGTNWYGTGEVVSISALPNPGYIFGGWSGDLSGTNNPTSITMNKDKQVVANFSAENIEWTILTLPEVSSDWSLNSVFFSSPNEGWAVGHDFTNLKGVLLHYQNGNWASIDPPNVSSDWELVDVYFTSNNEGWAIGNDRANRKGIFLHYRDGTWTSIDSPYTSSDWYLGGEVGGIHFTSPNEGWAIGYNKAGGDLLLFHYLGGSWAQSPHPYTFENWQFQDVHFTSPNDGWVVGYAYVNGAKEKGILLHYSNGSWTSVTLPSNVSSTNNGWELSSVHFTSPNNGWAVGTDFQQQNTILPKGGVLLQYTNESWAAVSPPEVGESCRLYGVHFGSPNDGWAVGRDYGATEGVLLHYDNGTWTSVIPPYVSAAWELHSVHFTSPKEGWAAGYDWQNKLGVLLRFCKNPGTPSTPSPQDGATGTSTNPTLSWDASPNADSYEVYFGTSSNPPLVATVGNPGYFPTALNPNSTYYWKVVVKDKCGSSSGPLWSFTTVGETITAPTTLTGPTTGIVATPYSFTAQGSTSSLGHSVEYQFDWKGDGSDLSPWGSASQIKTWNTSGINGVMARARCKSHTTVVSEWSDTLSVNITSNLILTVLKSGAGSGTVTSSPAGINCGDDCSETYTKVQEVKLTAKADTNSTFTGWSGGGCSGTKTCTVTVDASITVTVSFALKTPDISIAQTSLDFGSMKLGKKVTKTLKIMNNGTGDLMITLSGLEGTDFSIQGSSSFPIKSKKSYTLKVLCTPTSAGLKTATLEIHSNDPETPTLEISLSGTGPSEEPPDISVAQTSIEFGSIKVGENGTKTLRITNNGSGDLVITLSGLEGTDFSIWGSSSLTIKAKASYDLNVLFKPTSGGLKTATLKINSNDPDTPILDIELHGSTIEQPQQFALTVTKAGTGSGTVTSNPAGINCGSDCSESYDQGTSVTLTATADSSSTFEAWSGGGCSGTASCSVTINSNITITATFNQQPQYALTVVKSGTGSGTVSSSPVGINCGSDCSETYTKVQKVKLTAEADASSTFAGWSGGGCSGTKTCTVTVDAAVTVTADFALKTPDISVAQTSIEFGSVKVGKKVTKTLKITNNGTGDLVITLSGLEGTDFSIQGSSSVTIKAKKSYSLKVLFTPKSSGLETATLKVESNDPDTPILEIPLSGTGL